MIVIIILRDFVFIHGTGTSIAWGFLNDLSLLNREKKMYDVQNIYNSEIVHFVSLKNKIKISPVTKP